MKFSLWTPISAYYSFYPAMAAVDWLLIKPAANGMKFDGRPTDILKGLYFAVAGIAALVVSTVSAAIFLLPGIISALHDLIVGLGHLTGCCEIESDNIRRYSY
jgi:hypothetical protein